MIDFYWISRGLTSIRDQGYNGDSFGHLNAAGTTWAGGIERDALVYNPL